MLKVRIKGNQYRNRWCHIYVAISFDNYKLFPLQASQVVDSWRGAANNFCECYSQKITGLFSFKLCICRGLENQVNAEKKNKNEVQRQWKEDKKDQMERQKKENELRKNFQVIWFCSAIKCSNLQDEIALWYFDVLCVLVCLWGLKPKYHFFITDTET